MWRALAGLALIWAAGQSHAYTYVFQCDLSMGGAMVPDNAPQRVRFEVTYEWGQPHGWLVGAPGEVEIELTENDEATVVTSVLQTPDQKPAHTLTIQNADDSAVYVFTFLRDGHPVTYQWQGPCENMRPR